MCNTYCFSTTTTVSHTSLIVTFRLYIHWPSYFFLSLFYIFFLLAFQNILEPNTRCTLTMDSDVWDGFIGPNQSRTSKLMYLLCFYLLNCNKIHLLGYTRMYVCGTVVKVLCYKSEGRWFDSRWCHWNFLLT